MSTQKDNFNKELEEHMTEACQKAYRAIRNGVGGDREKIIISPAYGKLVQYYLENGRFSSKAKQEVLHG